MVVPDIGEKAVDKFSPQRKQKAVYPFRNPPIERGLVG